MLAGVPSSEPASPFTSFLGWIAAAVTESAKFFRSLQYGGILKPPLPHATTMESKSGKAEFPQTRWSIVLRATPDDHAGLEALGELCSRYWYPLYAFARRSGNPPADAEDLVQGFLAKASNDDLFSRADSDKGKLRTFLLTAFRRYARDEYEKSVAGKRGGGNVISFDAVEAENWYEKNTASEENPETLFDREWAVAVLENAMNRLARECGEKGKGEEFSAMRPFLTSSGTNADYERIAAETGSKPGTVKVTLHRLRARFGLALRDEIRDTQDEGTDIDSEINYLIQLL